MARITKPNKRSWAKETAPQTGRKFVNHWYHTVAWRKLRASVLSENPLCVHCHPRITLAQMVDHIKPVSSGRDNYERERLMWDRDNLQGLCNKCHNIKSAKEK